MTVATLWRVLLFLLLAIICLTAFALAGLSAIQPDNTFSIREYRSILLSVATVVCGSSAWGLGLMGSIQIVRWLLVVAREIKLGVAAFLAFAFVMRSNSLLILVWAPTGDSWRDF